MRDLDTDAPTDVLVVATELLVAEGVVTELLQRADELPAEIVTALRETLTEFQTQHAAATAMLEGLAISHATTTRLMQRLATVRDALPPTARS